MSVLRRPLALLLLLLLLGALGQSCRGASQCEGPVSRAFVNPRGSLCTRDCECNNFYYTGACVEGTCQSDPRPECEVPGQQRACPLPFHALFRACTQGVQTCQPPELQEHKRWGDCQLEKLEVREEGELACGDGKDNDCDGKVDSNDPDCRISCKPGEQRACYTGPTGTLNRGHCRLGFALCTNEGVFGPCEEESTPQEETCDGKDNDCDGQVDNGVTRPCYEGPKGTLDVGECRAGKQTCQSGEWGSCEGATLPQKEQCNEKDNDCDGKTDGYEVCPCPGACKTDQDCQFAACKTWTRCRNGTCREPE